MNHSTVNHTPEQVSEETIAQGCTCPVCAIVRSALREELDRRREKAERRAQRRTERMLARIAAPNEDGCHEWTGRLNADGYAHMVWPGKSQLVHRVIFEMFVGPIPDGLQVDHKCRNRRCLNPKHLQAVTSKQNNENRSSRSDTVSGARGVGWDANRQRWTVNVGHNRKRHYGGSFTDLDDAVAAAVKLRNSLYTNNLEDRLPPVRS